MKKLYILCLLTLAAVFVDIAFFHSPAVVAQRTTQISVTPVVVTAGPTTVGVNGAVVGFSCSTDEGHLRCFIASSN